MLWICAFGSFLTLDTTGTPEGHHRNTVHLLLCGLLWDEHPRVSLLSLCPCCISMCIFNALSVRLGTGVALYISPQQIQNITSNVQYVSWFARSSCFVGKGGLLRALHEGGSCLQTRPSAVLQGQRRVQKILILIQAGWEDTTGAVQSLCLSGH